MKFHGSASVSSLFPPILLLVLNADQTHRCVLAQEHRGIGLVTPIAPTTQAPSVTVSTGGTLNDIVGSSEAPAVIDADVADNDPTSTIILEPVISDDNNETIASEPEPVTLAPAETITSEPQPVPVDPTENIETIASEPEPATLAPAENNDTDASEPTPVPVDPNGTDGRTPPKPSKEAVSEDSANADDASSSGGHPSPNSRERGFLVWQLGSIGVMTLILLFGV